MTGSAARAVASNNHGDEGEDLWLTPKVTVEVLGTASGDSTAHLVCRDYTEA